MASNNIMQDIRNLLSEGKSSGEVIALGYKPPTVYKVQRQLRQKQQPNGRAPLQLMDQDQSITDREGPDELSAEDAEFFRCFFEPTDEATQSGDLRAQLDQARDRIEELEAEAGKVQVLQERVNTLRAEAAAGVALRRRVQELERDLELSSQTQTDLRQSSAQWQSKFQEERSAREQAERQARDCQEQASQWQQAYQIVSSKLEDSTQVIANLHAEIQKLEPLKAWAGHPCAVCGKPMTGSVSRELAANLQKGMGHKRCLEPRAFGLGKVLVTGGTLWGLSQLGKK
jgi:DNA repair exonuclease SbcCD ATPase subunit